MACTETILFAPRGADYAWNMTALDDAGDPVAFSALDSLSARVWSGGDSNTLFTPAATWTDAPAGEFRVSVTDTQTAAVTPGVYPFLVNATLASDSQVIRLIEAWLEIGQSPGSATTPPVYCTYQDMIDFGGGEWLDNLRRKDGQANFARERARARTYVDQLITNAYRPWDRRGLYNGYLDSGSDTPDARDSTIQGWLDDDALVVTDSIKELAALKSIELVCRQRITLDDQDVFLRRANYYRGLCRAKALTTTAELDTNANGVIDYAFPLGQINTR